MHHSDSLREKAERFKRRPCAHCGAGVENVHLYRTVTASGINQFHWVCAACNRRAARAAGENIPFDVIDAWHAAGHIPARDDIPVYYEYTGERCVVCGATGVELHHWAPQSMASAFGEDWIKWPVAYLCKEHHRQWHENVTPYLQGYKQRRDDFEAMFRELVGI